MSIATVVSYISLSIALSEADLRRDALLGQGAGTRLRALVHWARTAFKLQNALSAVLISHIMNNSSQLIGCYRGCPGLYSFRNGSVISSDNHAPIPQMTYTCKENLIPIEMSLQLKFISVHHLVLISARIL